MIQSYRINMYLFLIAFLAGCVAGSGIVYYLAQKHFELVVKEHEIYERYFEKTQAAMLILQATLKEKAELESYSRESNTPPLFTQKTPDTLS